MSSNGMPDDLPAALADGRLWREFCDGLKLAGAQVLAADTPVDGLTRAEGYRYLTRLLRLGLEKYVEFGDPDFPQFYSLSHETAKIGNDNPDNFYLNCAVDGRRDYRITGNRGSVAYLSIETKAGSFAGGGDMAPTGHVDVDQLAVAASGDFELVVSAREHPGNWLPMTPASDNILVRQTFRERRREQRAELRIECLNPQGSADLDPTGFATQLAQVVPFVTGTAGLFRQWMGIFAGHVNQLPPNDQQMCLRSGGDPAIYYHNSRWQLAPDQALLIEFTPPRVCRAWNFQLSNHWMESLDYRYHRICINNHSAVPEADGSVRILVSHRALVGSGAALSKAFPNWLETGGHSHGAMLLRYVAAEDYPPVSTRVVPLADVLPGSLEETA
jgi:hypothetical protein